MEEGIIHAKKHRSDFYALFKIPKDASEKEIEKAYKKLVLLLHPDKNPHPEAEELFKLVVDAREILTDPVKRQVYDTKGEVNEQDSVQIPLSVLVNGVLEWLFRGTVFQDARESVSPEGIHMLPQRSPLWHLIPVAAYVVVFGVLCLQTDTTHTFTLKPDPELASTIQVTLPTPPHQIYTTPTTHAAYLRSPTTLTRAFTTAYTTHQARRCSTAASVSSSMAARGRPDPHHASSICNPPTCAASSDAS